MAAVAAILLLLTACSSGKSSGTSQAGKTKKSGSLRIAYLQKQADQQYFVDELNGGKSEAKSLSGGITITSANLASDANLAISAVKAAIAQKADGIIIVPPDPAVGPQVVALANAANIPLLTSDDQICTNAPDPTKCDSKNLIPRVGFSGTQMGTEVGKKAGELFKTAGWKAADTAILSEWQQDVTVCTDRVKAAGVAFKAASGGASPRIINVGTDNTPSGAQSKTSALLNANRTVKHWVVWGCNDENVQGAVTALQNGTVAANDIIGVGLGAYLACKSWQSNKPTGMKAALFINGVDVGKLSVKIMYDHIRKGTAFPHESFAPTKMVGPTDWQQAGLKCV
ncbi:MAG: substrate-binding domain-containing protein [Mycobacteriales bacterium]